MIINAVRYCIGRQTYAVYEMTRWLILYWPEIPDIIRRVIMDDLHRAIEEDDIARKLGATTGLPLGSDFDRTHWMNVYQLGLKGKE